jgi:hypothetical protein
MNSFYKSWIIVAALLLAHIVMGQTDCELKRENKDLKVYTCASGDNKLNVLRAELILENTTLRELLDFVTDIKNYVNWQYNTTETMILKKDDRSIVFRAVVEAPWPLSSREMIMEITSVLDTARQVLTIDSHHVDYEYPETKDLIRVPYSVGTWHVSSLKNSLKVTYSLHIDPGGSVPAWLVNIAMADGPYYSLMKLKEAVKQKRL